MKTLLFSTLFVLAITAVPAQTTPMDFNRNDCNGVQRHLFADLDSGKAVIIEYFMINCAPCPGAGTKLEAMKNNLLTQFPGKVVSYAIAFNNTYTQAQVKNWVSSNGFNMIPMDSGATQVAYYGGMGMPTIVIAGGKTTHSVLGAPYIGFKTSDTTQMASDIRALLTVPTNTGSTVGLQDHADILADFDIYPNPAQDEITVSFDILNQGEYEVSLLDLNGKYIKTLMLVNDGFQKKTFSVNDLADGTYLVRVHGGNQNLTKKITIAH